MSHSKVTPMISNANRRVDSAYLEDETTDDKTLIHDHQHHVINLMTTSTYPFVLSFNNLSYGIKVHPRTAFFPFCGKGELHSQEIYTKVLLNDISGEAREGEIMAVLGASGAGKSTLIDALAGRIEKNSLKGTVRLNRELLESRLSKVISAYVMQDDLLFPMLTVEETLMFSAEFRIPRYVSKEKKQARVQALIDQLGLRRAAKTVIGDEGHRGVSGGERRRVSIGIDIIHDPILLFLDEPTSGLDSTSAFMVIKVLQRIAKSGSIVMMSMHQPSYRIVGLLDRLIFLSRGQTIYNGTPTNLLQFFEEFGRPVPENANQTEFALDLIRELEETPNGITSLVEFNKSWQTKIDQNKVSEIPNPNLSLKDAIKASISRGKLVSAGTFTNDTSLTSLPTFSNPFWIEMIVIAKRLLTNLRRMPEFFVMRLVTILVTGFILATLYWQLADSPKGTQGRLAFLSFALITIFFTCAEENPLYIQERFIFIRETAYNAYRCSSYVLAHSLVSIPSLIILSLAFSLTTFWAVGLAGGFSGFIFFFIINLAAFWAGSSFVAFISGLISDLSLSFTVVVSTLAYFLLFSGFYLNRDEIPSYWTWFHYISIVKYPYQAALQNEYSDPTKCFMKGVQLFDETPFMDVPMSMKMKLLESMSSTLGTNLTSSTCLTTGTKILEQKGATDISKWNCLWITLAWGLFFRILFYLTLLFGTKNKRK